MSKNDGGPAPLVDCSKCGGRFSPRPWQVTSRDYRCLPCKRSQQNTRNAENTAAMRERAKVRYSKNRGYWQQYADARRNDTAYKAKRAARRKVATEIEAGRIARLPCEVCRAVRADAHHDDYSKPLEIIWLCHRHHMERHAMLAERAKDSP